MALSVTHSTPADGTFSVAGGAAWDAGHSVSGLAAVATSGAYGDLSGNPVIPTLADAWPIGAIFLSVVATDPATLLGFGTWSLLKGKFLAGFSTGDAEFGTAGSTAGATGVSYTPSGTNAVVQFTPSGTNAISLFREAVAGTNAASVASGSVSVEYPTGVPVFAGATGSASVSVDWPVGKPVFTGVVHRHEVPIIHTSALIARLLPIATFGTGPTSRVPDVRATVTNVLIADVTNSGVVMLSNTATASGTISFPASVPQARVTGLVPAGIISWPATAPSAVFKTGTAAAQIFTGVTGSVSGQVFTGVTGTVSGQAFSGTPTTLSILPPYTVVYMWARTA